MPSRQIIPQQELIWEPVLYPGCSFQQAAWTELGLNLELRLILSDRGCFL